MNIESNDQQPNRRPRRTLALPLLLSSSTPLLLTFLLLTSEASAGPMTRNVEFVLPRVGQRGTTVDVRIQGTSLQDPKQIVFYSPGIRAVDLRMAPEPPPRRGLMHGAWVDQEIRCRFEISPDCRPGEHVFRVRTATELTNIGTFHVSPFRVIDEAESQSYENDSIEKAQPVSINTTIRGTLRSWARGDTDLYRVTGKAGQRISVEVDSARIANSHYGDSEFDAALRILDSVGRVLAADDDNSIHVQDPVASIRLPRDGDYLVEVSRSVFTPRDTRYCVHIGDNPRPRAVFPPGGPVGTRQKVKLIGDPLGEVEAEILIPKSRGKFAHFVGGPSSLPLQASPFPNLIEDTKAEVTAVPEIPVALNGIIDSATDSDSWLLTVKKDFPYRVRASASSLGSPIDIAIRIRPVRDDGSPGEVELQKDDSSVSSHDILGTGFRGRGGMPEAIDPSVIWIPKRSGQYRLDVIDSSGLGGPTGVYRIEVEPQPRTLHTYLASRTNDWTESMRVSGLVIPRGNRWTINLSLSTGQASWPKDDFELIAKGLPKGVRLVPGRIRRLTTLWPVQFEADEGAIPAGMTFRLAARSVKSGQEYPVGCQQSVPFINHSGGDAWRTVRMDRYVLAVTEAAPFTIDIDSPGVALVRGGELSIPVRITRHGDFKGPVQFRCGFAPRSITIPPPAIIPPGETEGVLQLAAQSNASLGTLPLVVLGSTIHEKIPDYLGAGHIRVSSKIVPLSVAQPYVELTSSPDSIRRGETKDFVWTIRHHTPFEGSATASLLGLPKGVEVVGPAPKFTAKSKQVVFPLKATDVALLGQATNLNCEVRVPVDGKTIVQRTGRGVLRIDPALKKTETARPQ